DGGGRPDAGLRGAAAGDGGPGARRLRGPAAGRAGRPPRQAGRLMSAPDTSAVIHPYTPILATLGYVTSPDGRQVLLVHRNRRPDDAHFGKYNGLGGKLQAGEDIVAGIRREISEEAGIECDALALRGTSRWPGFGQRGEA